MEGKQKGMKHVYVHKVPNTVKVENERLSSDGNSQSVLHYKRLVVPANMRSIYWKCYGFPADDNNHILTRTKIVCLLCKSQMTYNRNTTNLRMHLQNKHKSELTSLESLHSPPSSKAGKVDRRSLKKSKEKKIKLEQPVVQVYPLDDQGGHDMPQYVAELDDDNPLSMMVKEATANQAYSLADGKAIAEAIAEFIVMDLQNPEIVEGRGFQRLVGTLKSPCEIPKKNYLVDELIPNIHEVVREQLFQEVSSLQNTTVSLSVEDWQASTGELYSTIGLHYINNRDIELQSRVLGSVFFNEAEPEHWGLGFDLLCEEYKVPLGRVRAIVVASEREEIQNLLEARNFTLVPCFSHFLQSICSKCVYAKKEVEEVLKKCRAFIAHVSKNPTAVAEMKLQENLLQLEESPLLMDNKFSWMSTLTMLEQMQLRKSALSSVVDCISGSLCPTTSFELTDSDWKVLDDVISILSPFKVTVATLLEEKFPLISILKPIMCQLLSVHLEVTADDSPFAQVLKTDLAKYFVERYKGEAINELLELASALDPRFKNLPFLTDDERNTVKEKLSALLLKQAPAHGTADLSKSPAGKKRVSGMEYLLGELVTAVKSEIPTSQKADLELAQYEWEPQADLEKSPIEWWRESNGKCVHVYQLATEYLCTPICVRSHLQQTLTPSATLVSIPPHFAAKMKFLHANYVPVD